MDKLGSMDHTSDIEGTGVHTGDALLPWLRLHPKRERGSNNLRQMTAPCLVKLLYK